MLRKNLLHFLQQLNMTMDNPSHKKPVKWYAIRKNFVVSVLVSISIITFWAWWYHLPMGKGPAGPPVPDEPFQKVWKEGK